MLNQFVKQGQKEKIENLAYKFLARFSRTRNFSAF